MGKVLHDTSRLTEEYRSGVRRLTDFTTVLNIVEFPKALEFSGLNILYPTRVDYSLAIQVSKDASLPATKFYIDAYEYKPWTEVER